VSKPWPNDYRGLLAYLGLTLVGTQSTIWTSVGTFTCHQSMMRHIYRTKGRVLVRAPFWQPPSLGLVFDLGLSHAPVHGPTKLQEPLTSSSGCIVPLHYGTLVLGTEPPHVQELVAGLVRFLTPLIVEVVTFSNVNGGCRMTTSWTGLGRTFMDPRPPLNIAMSFLQEPQIIQVGPSGIHIQSWSARG